MNQKVFYQMENAKLVLLANLVDRPDLQQALSGRNGCIAPHLSAFFLHSNDPNQQGKEVHYFRQVQ